MCGLPWPGSTSSDEIDALLRMSAMAYGLWVAPGLYREGLQWVERALERSSRTASVGRDPGPRCRGDDGGVPGRLCPSRGVLRRRACAGAGTGGPVAGWPGPDHRRICVVPARRLWPGGRAGRRRLSSAERAWRQRAGCDSDPWPSRSSCSGISAWPRSSSTARRGGTKSALAFRGSSQQPPGGRSMRRPGWPASTSAPGTTRVGSALSWTVSTRPGTWAFRCSWPARCSVWRELPPHRAPGGWRASAWRRGSHRRVPRCARLPQRPAGSRSLPERVDGGVG